MPLRVSTITFFDESPVKALKLLKKALENTTLNTDHYTHTHYK